MAVNENSREAIQAQKKLEAKEEKEQSVVTKWKGIRLRLIPIWLRVLIVMLLISLSALTGAAVGYGVLGNGNTSDILQKSTWTHIIKLVGKE
ncbi:DNA-directed RNA polymerase subunit beta [Bacillus sp. V3B]|uniref:DNA-directed RNA polymerase subunit beta n=1 Tax=Bacillus sp. V3B TaxID=2804915 RepID=UPI00210C41FD|nr:DNA-directed RNA polymerase subunit beta [Bacillus sp. V3B]MCQ6274643.1 DNA-directed RNA polymerase subunit beta [Bacillus sp. V3B]